MDFAYYILTPFTWLLMFFYQFFNSYGVALILFALVVKLILFPLSLKGKRSMIQMNMLSGQMQKLQKQFGKDKERYNEEVQKLYAREKVNPMGGCLWSMLPLMIILPLYAIIRQPLKYMMGLDANQINAVAQAVNWAQLSIDNEWVKNVTDVASNLFVNNGYNQLYLASLITPENLAAVQAAVGETAKEIFSINFSFLGIELSQVPDLKFWVNGITWGSIGLVIVPLVSAGSSVVMSLVMTKTNNLNGQQNEQAAKTNKTMMLMSPLISLWIGFGMPAALSVYWIANNILGLAQETICAKLLKKDYEKAAQAQRQREMEEKEEEKRLRREKAEERARQAEEAKKNKGKKKEKPADEEKIPPQVREASRVGIRQYARGRAYDPNRFGGVTPYHEDVAAGVIRKAEEAKEAIGEEPVERAPALEEGKAPAQEAAQVQVVISADPAQAQAVAEEVQTQVEETQEDLVESLQAEIDAAVADRDQPKND